MNFYGSLLRKILEIQQFFLYTKIYETMKNFRTVSFYRICKLAAIITMRLLIIKIFCGDKSLISIFHFLCKAIVFVYYSVYLLFLLSKRILLCSLHFIKFLILCTQRSIVLFLTFLSYSFIFVICVFSF